MYQTSRREHAAISAAVDRTFATPRCKRGSLGDRAAPIANLCADDADVAGLPESVRAAEARHDKKKARHALSRVPSMASGPGRNWSQDVTHVRANKGLPYPAGVMDLDGRELVGWSLEDTTTTGSLDKTCRAASLSRSTHVQRRFIIRTAAFQATAAEPCWSPLAWRRA
jgi:transposase InsO family protein